MTAGNWNESANAGVFYRNLNNNRSNDNNNNGFRAADYAYFQIQLKQKGVTL